MKVVLLQDIKGLGKRMDEKNVPDGYARNFLLPKKLALTADKNALKQKEVAKQRLESDIIKNQLMVEKIRKEEVKFLVKTGDKGEVFEPVSAKMIENNLKEKGYDNFEIILSQSLKTLGEHQVGIKFPQGIKGEVAVILSA